MAAGKRTRILVITDHPVTDKAGPAYRVSRTLDALDSIGEVRVIFLRANSSDTEWNDSRVTVLSTSRRVSRLGRLYEFVRGWPYDSQYSNLADLQEQVSAILNFEQYDLIWVFRARAFNILNFRSLKLPLIVDFDDLYDLMFENLNRDLASTNSWLKDPSYFFKKSRLIIEYKRWSKYQKDIAKRALMVGVVSSDDQKYLNIENSKIIPNGYPDPKMAVSIKPDYCQNPCRMLMVGGYHYKPNEDAARFLATEVLPLVRIELPDAELYLVGRGSKITECLALSSGVICTGTVDTLDKWYAKATVAMTLLQSGAGSCIKVLEAMAYRKPIISTNFGVRGYNLEPNEHFMLAETASIAADHVIQLHKNPDTAKELAKRAYEHYSKNFEASKIDKTISSIALKAVAYSNDPKKLHS